MECSNQLGFDSLIGTFHLSPHENILTIARMKTFIICILDSSIIHVAIKRFFYIVLYYVSSKFGSWTQFASSINLSVYFAPWQKKAANYYPGQNSLAKCILFPYFPSHAHMSTLYKIFGTLFPPPTSMLLFLIKSLCKKRVLPLTTLILGGERGGE